MTEDLKKSWLRFVCRWQQFTGPIMAKGLEDTAYYVFNPLLSLNEVGGIRRAVSPEAFHSFNESRQRLWPITMNTTSTHDTKRSEDVRARLNVLTEMPDIWQECLGRWRELNASKKIKTTDVEIPDPNEEIFLYQTLLGVWPLNPQDIPGLPERLQTFLIKSLREAQIHSRWVDPNNDYEQNLLQFAQAILEEKGENEFLKEFLDLQGRVAYFGALNSLSQVLLKITSPGIPDFFQGNELWDFSLVDPDNRRPVDFKLRQKFLSELKNLKAKEEKSLPSQLLSTWKDGRIKLFITYKALQTRKNLSDLFCQGEYLPLNISGPRKEYVIVFARRLEEQWVLTVAGRFFSQLTEPEVPPVGKEIWQDTFLELPKDAPKEWRDGLFSVPLAIKGRKMALPDIFSRFPMALLIGSSENA